MAKKKSSKAKKCAGLKAGGKLKKGFTWKGASGGCPKKAAGKKSRKRK